MFLSSPCSTPWETFWDAWHLIMGTKGPPNSGCPWCLQILGHWMVKYYWDNYPKCSTNDNPISRCTPGLVGILWGWLYSSAWRRSWGWCLNVCCILGRWTHRHAHTWTHRTPHGHAVLPQGQALYNRLVDQPILRILLEFQGKVLSSNEIHVCPSHLPLSHGSFANIVHLCL